MSRSLTRSSRLYKRVRELPVHIDPGAYVLHEDWLATGYELVKKTWRDGVEYVFNDGALGPGQTGIGQLKYFEASRPSIEVFSGLWQPDDSRGLGEVVERAL